MPETVRKLVQLGVCNAEHEPTYDRVCRLARRSADALIATISFFDGSRHWLKARQNYDAEFVTADQSFCSSALLADDVFWVEDAAQDERFSRLDAVAGAGLRFYAGAPIRYPGGRRIGNVCVLDPAPRAYDPELARDLRDLAQVVSDELALKEAERRVAESLAERTAAQASQSRLLSILSHELRTPLNGAVGATSVLKKSVTDRGARELVSVVAESCAKLERLVESLLAFSSAQEDEAEVATEPCDMRTVLSDALALVAPAAKRRGVELLRVDANLPPLLDTDGSRVGQIVYNLLSNAVQHADGGLVKLEASWRAPDRLCLAVIDTGPGIRPERLDALFEPFNRDAANIAETAGLGLGLATTRRLAIRLGGDVHAESGPSGCVFRVELTAPRSKPKPSLVAPLVLGARAMVVDDHPANLIVQSRLLETLGYEAETFDNATDALTSASGAAFDLVLTDINMPGIDGYQFVEKLRSMGGWRASVPVYAVSASLPPSGVQKEPPPGFHGWLTKPVDLTKLRAALEQSARMRPSPLWRLIYVSRSVDLAGKRLQELLEASRTLNARDGITGVLAVWNGWCVQVLEGGRAEVEATFSRIARDRRHSDVVLVSSRACEARRFERWSMAAVELDTDDRDASALLLTDAAPSPGTMSESALILLLELVERRAVSWMPADAHKRKAVGA